jgi:hypothetical protein
VALKRALRLEPRDWAMEQCNSRRLLDLPLNSSRAAKVSEDDLEGGSPTLGCFGWAAVRDSGLSELSSF